MNRWRLVIFLLALVAIGLLVASFLIKWEPWDILGDLRAELRSGPAFRRPSLTPEPHSLLSILSALLTLYLAGLLILYAFPRRIRRMEIVATCTLGGYIRLTALGLLTGLLLIILSLGAALTMVTFPLSVLGAFTLVISSYIGFITLAYTVGRVLLVKAEWSEFSPSIALLLGLLLLFPLAELPFLGIIGKIFFAILGTGIVTASRFGSSEPWSLLPLIKD